MKTVLVVDDSLTVRMDLAEALDGEGIRAVPCASLAEARQALGAGPVGLVVLDQMLPDGEGTDLLTELRSDPNRGRIPVLMLSSDAEVRDRIRGLTTGADEYVGKPYDRGYVVARARELVGSTRAPGATVLVIDDSPTFTARLAELLKGAGHHVISTETGEEGLRLAAEHRPAAILVDGVLPGIDGPTVIRRVRLDTALWRTRCVLLTASDDAGAELQALDAGADAFVRKVEDMDVILARISAVLRSPASWDERDDEGTTLGPKRVLAVDDSPTYLDALGAALRSDGYDVVPARSGEEALELLAVQPVDCILLDLVMPGLGGTETCRRIKLAPRVRDIPLIMLTALEDRDSMIAGLGAGADDFVYKGSDLDVLKARLRAQVRRRHLEDETRRVHQQLAQRERQAAEARAAGALADTRATLIAQLERKNRELEAFSYTVSHDLRAPLRAIDGFSQALAEDCGDQLDARGLGHLKRVRAAAQRMGELIDDLLELSRVSRTELSITEVDLTGLAEEVFDDLRRRDPDRSVETYVQRGLTARGDRGLLRVVLENLLGNSWKFTQRRADAMIELITVRSESGTAYQVRDNGVGFSMQYADRLFRPFQRLHAVADFPGTGIGLATVHRVIELHGGLVWAEGEPGLGATVRFTLPPDAPWSHP